MRGAVNRRHQRVGHLCQNRYKSIVVEEAPYLLELTRYLHLNPLRAGVVADFRALDRSPWTGHRALLGARPCPWQATGAILQQFGPMPPRARKAYRAFVAAGVPLGRRPELQGGGLIRSLGAGRRSPPSWGCGRRRCTGPRSADAPPVSGGIGCSRRGRQHRTLGSNVPDDPSEETA